MKDLKKYIPFLQAVQHLNCSPENVLMIGDDVHSDIAGAMNAGLMACLVKTGKYRKDDEKSITPPPTCVANDFNDAVQWILQTR